MIFMGIDQSFTGSGITIIDNDKYYYYLIESKKTKDTKSPTIDYTKRLIKIINEYDNIIKKHNPEYIAIEGLSYGSKSSIIFDLGGLSHLARNLFIINNIKFIVIPPKTLKKYFTNNGNANKIEMINEALSRGANIPFFEKVKKEKIFNNNVVDSYALATFLKDFIDNKIPDYENKIERSWVE